MAGVIDFRYHDGHVQELLRTKRQIASFEKLLGIHPEQEPLTWISTPRYGVSIMKSNLGVMKITST